MFGCVSAYFCGGHKITYGCNFLATLPLIWMGFSGTCFVVVVVGGGGGGGGGGVTPLSTTP